MHTRICDFLSIFLNVCVYTNLCVWWPWKPEEGIGPPGAGLTCSCELSDVGAGNQTWVFWKSSKCSHTLSNLSSPVHFWFLNPNNWMNTRVPTLQLLSPHISVQSPTRSPVSSRLSRHACRVILETQKSHIGSRLCRSQIQVTGLCCFRPVGAHGVAECGRG